jgi:co-chaperonin GroES (HSP10)
MSLEDKLLKQIPFYNLRSQPLLYQIQDLYESLPDNSNEKLCGAIHISVKNRKKVELEKLLMFEVRNVDHIKFKKCRGLNLIVRTDMDEYSVQPKKCILKEIFEDL